MATPAKTKRVAKKTAKTAAPVQNVKLEDVTAVYELTDAVSKFPTYQEFIHFAIGKTLHSNALNGVDFRSASGLAGSEKDTKTISLSTATHVSEGRLTVPITQLKHLELLHNERSRVGDIVNYSGRPVIRFATDRQKISVADAIHVLAVIDEYSAEGLRGDIPPLEKIKAELEYVSRLRYGLVNKMWTDENISKSAANIKEFSKKTISDDEAKKLAANALREEIEDEIYAHMQNQDVKLKDSNLGQVYYIKDAKFLTSLMEKNGFSRTRLDVSSNERYDLDSQLGIAVVEAGNDLNKLRGIKRLKSSKPQVYNEEEKGRGR